MLMSSRKGGRTPVHRSLRGQLKGIWNMSRRAPWGEPEDVDKRSKEERRNSEGEVKGNAEHGK